MNDKQTGEEKKTKKKNSQEKTKQKQILPVSFFLVVLIEVVSFCHLTNVNVYQTQDNHLTIIIFDDIFFLL